MAKAVTGGWKAVTGGWKAVGAQSTMVTRHKGEDCGAGVPSLAPGERMSPDAVMD